jgi:chromate transporter
LCPDRNRAAIALAAVITVVAISGPAGQVLAIVMGALAGMMLCRGGIGDTGSNMQFPVSRRVGFIALSLFVILLAGLPLLALLGASQTLAFLDAFYRAGALVFGGGHVVLPLLEAEVVQSGWVTADDFLAGYGAAQAVPGPLFTFAAYLGTVMEPAPNGVIGAALALVMIFVPGFLLLMGVLPFWNHFRALEGAQAVMRGANAAVVGILAAALYHPLWTSAIIGPKEFALALTGFLLLARWALPSWMVVLIIACGGILIAP